MKIIPTSVPDRGSPALPVIRPRKLPNYQPVFPLEPLPAILRSLFDGPQSSTTLTEPGDVSAVRRTTPRRVRKKGRTLTAGERAMVQKVFGNSIDLDKVQVHNRKYSVFQNKDTIMAPNGNIYYPKGHYRADFSKESKWKRDTFMHEMTHVWQHQMGVNVLWRGAKLHMGGGNPYKYTLDANKDLSDYNIEQQGEIVSLYYMDKSGSTFIDPAKRKKLYAVLERFIENPASYRNRMMTDNGFVGGGDDVDIMEELRGFGFDPKTDEDVQRILEQHFGDPAVGQAHHHAD